MNDNSTRVFFPGDRPVTRNLTVRGMKVTTRTPRRYAVVVVRPHDVYTNDGIYVRFAEVQKRTDNITTARTAERRYNFNRDPYMGVFAVVIDLTTGEEV